MSNEKKEVVESSGSRIAETNLKEGGSPSVRCPMLSNTNHTVGSMKMKEGDTIDEFVGKLSEISSNSAALGETIDEPKLVKKFLNSLPPRRFIHIIAALEQVLDLNKTSFEDIVGKLKAYEEKIGKEEEEHHDDPSKLMFANTGTPQQYQGAHGGNRGRGRGGRSNWRGRGRGRNGGYQDGNFRELSDEEYLAGITCFRCDQQGHYASD
ncbi:unnamed protein product, partial [Microthlaspi erraticum]